MAGRPQKRVSDAQRQEIVRLAKRRKGYRAIVRITGMGQSPVRRVMAEEKLRRWRRLDIRDDLTLRQCADLTGRSEPTLLAAFGKGELALFQSEGAWRCWPVELQRWVLADPSRIDTSRWENPLNMLQLLCGHWGGDVVRTAVTEETARKVAQRRRKAERDGVA